MPIHEKTFRYYLKRSENVYYTISQSGNVTTTPNKIFLGEIVANWKGVPVEFSRSERFHGVFRQTAYEYEFVLDGAKILRHIVHTYGHFEPVIFYIEKLDTTSQEYNKWFEGDIDLRQIEDEKSYFKCSCIERNAANLLLNREMVDYEIDLDVPEAVLGQLDGVRLGARIAFIVGDQVQGGSFAVTRNPRNITTNAPIFILGNVIPITNIQAGMFVNTYTQEWVVITGPTIPPDPPELSRVTNGRFFIDRSGLGSETAPSGSGTIQQIYPAVHSFADFYNVRITGNITFSSLLDEGGSGDARIRCYATIVDNVAPFNNTQYILFDIDNIPRNQWEHFSENFDISIPFIPENHLIYFQFSVTNASSDTGVSGNGFQFWNDVSFIDITYLAKVPPTQYKALRYIDLWKHLVRKITGGLHEGDSKFLGNINSGNFQNRQRNIDNSPYHTIVTSGDGLRNLPDPKIKTNLNRLLQDAFTQWGLGIYEKDGKLWLEPLREIYAQKELLRIEHINNLRISTDFESFFNNLRIGYNDSQNDNVEGKNEFNTLMQFLVEKNVVGEGVEKDMVSPYIAAVYSIESARAETFDQERLDNRFDNEIFLIEIDPVSQPGGYFLPYIPNSLQIAGVDDPENMYNVTLSPKRKLLRLLPYLRSFADKGWLRYQTTERNPDMFSRFSTSPAYIIETEDVDLEPDVFPPPYFPSPAVQHTVNVSKLFKPFIIEFDCAPPYNLDQIMEIVRTEGYVTFIHNGTEYRGYILNIGCYPATKDKFTFRLQCHTDTDLSKIF